MERFVELCVAQYIAETQKVLMKEGVTATSIVFARKMCFERNADDISKYAKSPIELEKMRNEFLNAVKEIDKTIISANEMPKWIYERKVYDDLNQGLLKILPQEGE